MRNFQATLCALQVNKNLYLLLRNLLFVVLSFSIQLVDVNAQTQGLMHSEIIEISEAISKDLKENRPDKAIASVQEFITNKTRSSTNDLAIVPILDRVFEKDAFRMQGIVDNLVQKRPGEVIPRLLKGKFYRSYAWQARGEKFIGNSADGALDLYKQRLLLSHQELKEALKIEPNNTLVAYYLYRNSFELGLPELEREIFFSIATKEVSFFLSAYLAKVDGLAPKWGGSEQELLKFISEVAWVDNSESSLPFIVPVAYGHLCTQYGGKAAYFAQPKVWADVERAYEILLTRFPKAAFFKTRYAKDLFILGYNQKALQLLKEAHQLEPTHADVVTQVKKHPEALHQTNNVSNTVAIDNIRQQAKERYKARDWQGAKKLYAEVVTLEPTDAHSWYLLGFIEDKIGNYKSAIINFDQAISLRPNKATYYTYRCHSKMLLGEVEAGINDCTKAISIDSREKYAYLNRAHAYQMMGKQSEAQQDLKIASTLQD